MNGDTFDQDFPIQRKDRRSLSFSHSRFHRRNSSSEDDNDDGSPVRYFQNEYDDEFSRDSLSEFSRVTLEDGRGHRRDTNDDLSAITRKRTFSSSDPQSGDADLSKNGKPALEKRAATKVCRVCGDKAYSYNFSVVTCESCKAFFRRNANKDKDIRCPFNDNCDINIVSRRFCQKCRLAKCFKVGMRKEWILSEEARREKKQRIQDNRERRMAERAQEEKMAQHEQMSMPQPTNNQILDQAPTQIITNGIQLTPPSDPTIVQSPMGSSIGQGMAPLAPLNSTMLPNLAQAPSISAILPPVVSSMVSMQPPVVQSLVSQTEPSSVMQQVIQQAQQAQQVQNAQLLAQVAMQSQQPDTMSSIQQAVQLASIGTTAVSASTNNAVQQVAANLNHLAQVAAMQQQTPSEAMASIQQQAAQIASTIGTTSVQSPTTNASIVSLNNLAQAASQIQQKVQLEQMQQQINANIAAQRIQASQNLADQQQLAAAISVAALSNQSPIVAPSIPEPIQPSIATGILPSLILAPNPPPLTAVPLAPTLEPVMQPVLPSATNSNEMIAVRKDVLLGIVQENIDNRQAQIQQQINTPPAKCKCTCMCGRYSNDSVIVDRVMSDMLQEAKNSITPPTMNQQVESMDCSRPSIQLDIDCCLLSEDDKLALNELEQADKIFWANDPNTIDSNASDAALRKVIRMVTSLNSFNKLSRSDQTSLLRHGCPSHFVIRQTMSGNLNENQMVVQFFSSLREEWRSNHQLLLLISIMVIFDSDCPGLENKAQVAQTCIRLKSILKRMLFTLYLDPQKTILEFGDLINKLNVLQSLNNNPLQQSQNGVDSYRRALEPLLSLEFFEPQLMMTTSNVINTISSMT